MKIRKLFNIYFVLRTLRLRLFPRYRPTETRLLSKRIRLVDAASFLSAYEEIFGNESYKFPCGNKEPHIIDCGANIGLSIIYFKRLYPESKIIAFEPDPKVFEALNHNINTFEFKDVALIQKGVWNTETTLPFFSEGADAGRITAVNDSQNIIKIQTTRLRDYLDRRVDLLKIDIEGAETVVLEDCRDNLKNVQNIFVEYHSFKGQQQTLHTILDILAKADFRYYIRQIRTDITHPFIARDVGSGMDLQLNIYAFRL
ncbi:MAG TPA: FkbM family methyltransferase [Candidatus Omnitrophota bacterium]|nr:FkbM family methyltransferase [Candidatus Omnitrophota bacterium]HPD85245.1 FkbM family methyltransferase [Candidatus Omnitrophota bacterium]HRZ04254.1 FkbM family methyltransferase [Candidatus Omnitrophota bacterium]